MRARVVSVAALAAALVLGAAVSVTQLPHYANAQTTQSAAVQTLPDFAAIVERNKAAVVNITSSVNAKPGARAEVPELPEEFRNGPFGEFFRRFQTPQPNVPRQ